MCEYIACMALIDDCTVLECTISIYDHNIVSQVDGTEPDGNDEFRPRSYCSEPLIYGFPIRCRPKIQIFVIYISFLNTNIH